MALSVGEIEATIALNDQMSKELTRIEGNLASFGRGLEHAGMRVTEAGRAMLPFSAAVGALSTYVIKAAADFEWSFAGVRRTVDGVVDSTGELTEVGADIREAFLQMALEIPASVNELNAIGTAAGQLGIKSENIVEFTRVMAMLGVTTNLASDDAAMAIARIQNIFQKGGEDVDRFGSALVALGRDGASTEKDIVTMGVRIAASAKVVGMSQADVLGFANALSSLGIKAEAGGTAISKLMIDMAASVDKGGERVAMFAEAAKMPVQAFSDLFRKDAAQAIIAFLSGLAQMDENSKTTIAIINELGLNEVRLRNTLLATAGAGEYTANSVKLSNTAWEENTALTQAAEQRYRTFRSQMILFKNVLENIAITFGTALMPTILDMVNEMKPFIMRLREIATGFDDVSEPVKRMIVTIAGAITVAAPLLIGLGGAIRVVGFAFGGLSEMATLFGKALSAMGLGSILQPLKILAAQVEIFGVRVGVSTTAALYWSKAMKALEAAQMWLWSNSSLYANISVYGVKTGLAVTATSLWASASAALTTVMTGLRAAIAFMTGPIGLVVAGVSLLVLWFAKTENGSKALGAIWEWLSDIGGSLWSIIKSVGSVLSDVLAIGFKMAELQAEAFTNLLSKIWAWAGRVKDEFVNLVSKVTSFAESVARYLPGGETLIRSLGKLRDGISDIAGLFQAVAGGIHSFAVAIGAVKDELPKVESPMKGLNTVTKQQYDLNHLLSDSFTASITPVKKVQAGIKSLTDEQKKQIEEVAKLAAAYNGTDMRKGFDLWTAALPKIGDLSKLTVKAQEEIRDELGELIDTALAAGKEIPPAIKSAYSALANNTTVKQAMREMTEWAREKSTEIIEAQREETRKVTDLQAQQFESALDAAVKIGDQLYDMKASDVDKMIYQAGRERDETLRAIEPLKKLWPDMYENARQATLAVYAKSVEDAKREGAKVVGTFGQKMAELPNVIMAAIQGGGSVFKSVFGFIGTTILGEENALTKMLHGGISKIATKIGGDFGANLATSLSNMLPGLGAALGPALGALGSFLGNKLFGSAGRDAVKAFAESMGGFDELRAKLIPLGDEGERLWKNLTQGVGKNDPKAAKAAIEAINEALKKQETELKAVDDALKKYGITWSDMKGEAFAKGLSEAMKVLAEDTRLLMLGGLDHKAALEAQAKAYNELIQQAAKAGEQMPLELLKVAREMASLGLLTEETIAVLMGGAESALPSWKDMEEAAKKYGIELSSLGDKFRQSRLNDLANEYAKDFQLLVDGGADVAAVAAGMADEVNAALSEALKYGLEVPASMRPLLEALLESGQLLDENGEVMKDLSKVKFGETLAQSTDRLIAKLDELIRALTGGVGGAIDDITEQFHKFVDNDWKVKVTVETSGINGESPETMAAGGMFRVTKPTLFMAGEAGPEDAYFSGGGRSFGRPGAAAYPDGGGGGGGDIYLLVERDGGTRELTREQFKQLERAMANGVVKVPRRAIGERVQ